LSRIFSSIFYFFHQLWEKHWYNTLMKKPNCAIAYFSRSGNTRSSAGILAERLSVSAVYPITEVRERRGLSGFIMNGFSALRGKAVNIKTTFPETAGEIDQLILMTPVWAGHVTPAINGFLERTDLTGTQVILITVQSDPEFKGIEKAVRLVEKRIINQKGVLKQSAAMHGSAPGKKADRDHLTAEIDRICPLLNLE